MATDSDIGDLTRRSAEGNAALARGDIDGFLEQIVHSKDYTLMAPFGGAPTRGLDTSRDSRAAMARFFKADTFDQEVVATYGSGDLVVLMTIERVRGKIGGLPDQHWSLRVTQVYRREGREWQLVHRHADPLLKRITVEEAAALARGET
jgi:ketosteroid isomerase-like protein